ncbi:MAG: Omp28-related outer membrane protein [Bacteroides sp.]|nr:Omp28-related outer membrane protein [Bacteroides sp.]MCM1378643.1 Omp28-related outer membrane protein [Bacteroides sp.]MCM1446383.1 Omp28-related outer membrane protein [Prevotella sp.]
MKKLLLSLSVAAMAALSVSAETIDLGYVSTSQDQVYPATGVATAEDDYAYAAAMFPADMMSIYAGGRITGLRIGWADYAAKGDAEAFIRIGDLNAESIITKSATLEFGWNTVMFDSPYFIPEKPDNVIIGYSVPTKANTYCIGCSVLGRHTPNSCFLAKNEDRLENGKYSWADGSQHPDMDALLIIAIVDTEGTDMNDRAEITDIYAPEIFTQGDTGSGLFTISNRGSNSISSVELTYTCGDKSQSFNMPLGSPIAANNHAKVSAPISTMASGDFTVKITKVNGNENGFPDSHILPVIAVPKDAAEKYTRRSLLEYYGSEGEHYNITYYEEHIMAAYAGHENEMSIVCHHTNDQFMTRDDEDTQLLLDLANGDKYQVQVPCMTLDRSIQAVNGTLVGSNKSVAYSIPFQPFASYIVNEALTTPTFATINVTNSYDSSTAQVHIDVDGFIEPDVLPAGEKLCLTVYLLENNVASTSQDWADEAQEQAWGGVYYHQNVIRQQPSPIWGTELDDAEGAYSNQFVAEIDPDEWKPEDMHVVAVLHRGEKNSYLSRQVINCAETDFDLSSIHEISAAGSDKAARVYNLSGVEVTGSKLPAGVYVVTNGRSTSKVLVK